MSQLIPPYRFSRDNTKVKRFWEELERNRIVTTKCKTCNEEHWPPKSFCSSCYSTNIDWFELPFTGTLLTYTKVLAPPEGFPIDGYYLGIVQLTNSEIRVFGQISISNDILSQGMKVKLNVIEDESHFRYFQFVPHN